MKRENVSLDEANERILEQKQSLEAALTARATLEEKMKMEIAAIKSAKETSEHNLKANLEAEKVVSEKLIMDFQQHKSDSKKQQKSSKMHLLNFRRNAKLTRRISTRFEGRRRSSKYFLQRKLLKKMQRSQLLLLSAQRLPLP